MTNSTKTKSVFVVGCVMIVIIVNHLSYLNGKQIGVFNLSKTSKGANEEIGITQKQVYSAFYGMKYIDSYGLPLSFFDQKSLDFEEEDWKAYFPKLTLALKLLNLKNPEANASLNTQSFHVTPRKIDYVVGEELVATITSLDGEGRPKTFGGDYYRARLIKKNKQLPDGIPCRVTDNSDGTYSLKAPSLLSAVLTLEVTLVIGVEGVNEIVDQVEKVPYWGNDHEATLENNETTICNIIFTNVNKSNLCDYSNPRNKEPWFCFKPPSKTCPKIVSMKYASKNFIASTVDFNRICSKYHCYKRFSKNITVEEKSASSFKSTMKPACSDIFSESHLSQQISGYFAESRWHHLLCDSPVNSISFVQSCLSNKVIYLFGDSTIRQFFYLFVSKLKLQVDGPDNSVIWQQPKYAHDAPDQHYNISMFYRAHGPPLLNPGPSYTRPYMSDSITDIPEGGDHVYVIFNIGAHLYGYHPRFYLHRLKGIKSAILKHQQRFPNTKFIVRGLNIVEWSSEWHIYRFEVLLRRTFSNMKNVAYLNFWDVTTVWPLDDYHPRPTVADQQAVYMLRYICS